MKSFFFFVLSSSFFQLCFCKSKRYQAHERIDVIANTVGPFNNPTETYPYYSLPFCEHTGKQQRHKMAFGETLTGSRKVTAPYEVTFLDPVPWRALCEENMDAKDVRCLIFYHIKYFVDVLIGLYFLLQLMDLKAAIEKDYFFEMFFDELPLWGYIGEVIIRNICDHNLN